jgi:hypothetical protein
MPAGLNGLYYANDRIKTILNLIDDRISECCMSTKMFVMVDVVWVSNLTAC